jgi:hypothetical protein
MPAADVDLTLMIREGQNSVGAERPPHRPRPGNPVVRGLEIILTRSGCRPPRRIGGCRPLRREGPKSPPRNRGVPTHSIGRAPKLCHRDRGADPLHREGPEITSPRSGGADPLVGRARNHLTEIGNADPLVGRARKSPHRNRGMPTHSVGRGPKSPHRNRGMPTHSVGRGPKSPHRNRGMPTHSVGRARNHLTEIGGMPTHSVGGGQKSPHRNRGMPTPSSGGPEIVLTRSGGADPSSGGASKSSSRDRGCRRGGLYHTARRRGAESMCLALDVLEGQNFAGVDHDGVVPGGSRAARLPAVDALDCDGQLIPSSRRR